ncbi:MAG: PAAR-like domain-containing protein [Planctomycetota bacterium]|jgi:hypothetical protein
MFAATNSSQGMIFCFPDVCKVPAPPAPFAPVPFPNIVTMSNASGSTCSKKVKILNKKTVTKKTEFSRSSGNEAATAGGGMKSAKQMGKAKNKQGSSKVKAEGAGVSKLGNMAAQNGAPNANFPAGAQIVPSQTKVIILG